MSTYIHFRPARDPMVRPPLSGCNTATLSRHGNTHDLPIPRGRPLSLSRAVSSHSVPFRPPSSASMPRATAVDTQRRTGQTWPTILKLNIRLWVVVVVSIAAVRGMTLYTAQNNTPIGHYRWSWAQQGTGRQYSLCPMQGRKAMHGYHYTSIAVRALFPRSAQSLLLTVRSHFLSCPGY